jgi:hypothetical protein
VGLAVALATALSCVDPHPLPTPELVLESGNLMLIGRGLREPLDSSGRNLSIAVAPDGRTGVAVRTCTLDDPSTKGRFDELWRIDLQRREQRRLAWPCPSRNEWGAHGARSPEVARVRYDAASTQWSAGARATAERLYEPSEGTPHV